MSTSDCWAIGYFFSNGFQSLIERWDGSSWTIVASASAGPGASVVLNGVTCVSASQCWAVGYYYNGSKYQTLIERWDGSSWAVTSSPNSTLLPNSVLSAVSCTGSSDCWAVGHTFQTDISYKTLIEHWDGTSWTIVDSPNGSQTSTMNYLNGVTCSSASECWAVGYYHDQPGYQTLIERWDGISWTVFTSPNTSPNQSNFLHSVRCTSHSDCWAVGAYGGSGDGIPYQTLTEHWDGTSWTIIPSPNTSAAKDNYLWSVTCSSASNCWAVGSHGNTDGQTLIEQWNGAAWSIAGAPSIGTTQSAVLRSATCLSASECWAVGSYRSSSGSDRTLVEKYTSAIPQLVSVASRITHNGAATFDIDLPVNGTRGVECRTGNSNGAGSYTMIFTFTNNLTSVGSVSVTSGTGTIDSDTSGIGPNPNQYSVNLAEVSNAQSTSVALGNVVDSEGSSGAVSGIMGVLIGDVNGDGFVNVGDTIQTKSQSGNTVTNSNFRYDVNADGLINVGDTVLVKNKSGTALPEQ